MKRRGLGLLAGSVLACVVAAGFGFAAPMKDHHTNITFYTTMKFQNGVVLPAGTYRMQVPEDTKTPSVTFLQNGKVKAQVPAQVFSGQNKNENTQVSSVASGNSQLVKSISPSGWTETITFGPSAGGGGQNSANSAAE